MMDDSHGFSYPPCAWSWQEQSAILPTGCVHLPNELVDVRVIHVLIRFDPTLM